jgi:hypothetical protein
MLEMDRLRQRIAAGVGRKGASTAGGDFLSGLNRILNPSSAPPQQVNVNVSRED